MQDFLLSRVSLQSKSAFQTGGSNDVKSILSLVAQHELLTSVPPDDHPIQISSPDKLSTSNLQLEASQCQVIRNRGAEISAILRAPYASVTNFIRLEEDEEKLEDELCPISPPLIARTPSKKDKVRSAISKELVSSICDDIQIEATLEASPILSNSVWNDLDPFQRPSFTPPSQSSSPLSNGAHEKIHINILSPNSNIGNWSPLEDKRKPFEMVLFPRSENLISNFNRSKSFNPKQCLNSYFNGKDFDTARLDEELNESNEEKQGILASLDLDGLVQIETWDNNKIEQEIFGAPLETVESNSKLKKISVKTPHSSPRGEPIEVEFQPPSIDAFRLTTTENKISRERTLQLNEDLRKVEGLRALNIDLSWNSYEFSPEKTLEQILNLDKTQVEMALITSSDEEEYSLNSKRIKTEHEKYLTNDSWPKLRELLEFTESDSSSPSCSSFNLNSKKSIDSTSPTLRTDQGSEDKEELQSSACLDPRGTFKGREGNEAHKAIGDMPMSELTKGIDAKVAESSNLEWWPETQDSELAELLGLNLCNSNSNFRMSDSQSENFKLFEESDLKTNQAFNPTDDFFDYCDTASTIVGGGTFNSVQISPESINLKIDDLNSIPQILKLQTPIHNNPNLKDLNELNGSSNNNNNYLNDNDLLKNSDLNSNSNSKTRIRFNSTDSRPITLSSNHPPPIPIPNQLLDRSRLKPIPTKSHHHSKNFNQSSLPLLKFKTNLKSISTNSTSSLNNSSSSSPESLSLRNSNSNLNNLQTSSKSDSNQSENLNQKTNSFNVINLSNSTQIQLDHNNKNNSNLSSSSSQMNHQEINQSNLNPSTHDDNEIQSWQLNPSLPATSSNSNLKSLNYPSSLERTNSDAARLDSLAKLNGIKFPTTSSSQPNRQFHPDDDTLPPFLMAKHLEETQRKLQLDPLQSNLKNSALQFKSNPTNTNLSNSLGFCVGPNGRGVPRLSALQRKALEKMTINHQNHTETGLISPPSLSRSHTTTGVESIKFNQSNHQFQISSPDESQQRQEARSNLIRKLSSRRPTSPKLQANSSPTSSLQTFNNHHLNPHPTNHQSNQLNHSSNSNNQNHSSQHQSQKSIDQLQLDSPKFDDSQIVNNRIESQGLNDIALLDPRIWPDDSSRSYGFILNNSITPPISNRDSSNVNNDNDDLHELIEDHVPSTCYHSSRTTLTSSISELSDFTLNSQFRSYRHSIERDRDSVLDRMGLIDNTIDNEISSNDPSTPTHLDSSNHHQPLFNSILTNHSNSNSNLSHSTNPVETILHSNLDNLNSSPSIIQSELSDPKTPLANINPLPSQSITNSITMTNDHYSPPPPDSNQSASRSQSLSSITHSIQKDTLINNNNEVNKLCNFELDTINSNSSNASSKSIASRLKSRSSLSSRVNHSLHSRRSQSPHLIPSDQMSLGETFKKSTDSSNRQSFISQRIQSITERRQSGTSGVLPYSSSNQSKLTRTRTRLSVTTTHSNRGSKTFDEQTNRPSSGSISSKRISLNHNDSGPSQFPPTPHLVRTHMPAASPADLARYNDQKLAPFPALLNSNTTPFDRSKSSKSINKLSKSSHHSLLSSASNFFNGSNNRARSGSISNGISTNQISHPKILDSQSLTNQIINFKKPNVEDDEKLIGRTQGQSMGDFTGKLVNSTQASRSSSTNFSVNSSNFSNARIQRRDQILNRLAPFLTVPSNTDNFINSESKASTLNNPPRKLLWHQSVLQVVSATSVKDRYLFLFNDLLVIAKPIVEFDENEGERIPRLPITLQNSFITKSVVELKYIRCVDPQQNVSVGYEDLKEDSEENKKDKLSKVKFVCEFDKDPKKAVKRLFNGKIVNDEPMEISKWLLTNLDLDKRQLGQYLLESDQSNVLRCYLERLKFEQMRIEDSLRLVLLTLRLPSDREAIERFLNQFGKTWSMANEQVGINAQLATRWATEMIVLSEHAHGSLTDSMRYVASLIGYPNGIKTEAQFVDYLKKDLIGDFDNNSYSKKPKGNSISDEKLENMLKKSYQSIRRDRLVQGRSSAKDVERIELTMGQGEPKGNKKLPNRLTYQVESDEIIVSIPEPDSQFGIKLFGGASLRFEPPFLSFSKSSKCTFKIKGRTLGICQMAFVKIGARAAAYEGLPLIETIMIERAFMKHTVQIGFINHLQASRKYLFSFEDQKSKDELLKLIYKAQKQENLKESMIESSSEKTKAQSIRRIAALQVLRDTLIINEDLIPLNVNPHVQTTIELKFNGLGKNRAKQSTNESKEEKQTITTVRKIRSNSISEIYTFTNVGSVEKDLQNEIIKRRQQAQLNHIKFKQKELLKESLKSNLIGGKQNLNPYSISNKDLIKNNVEENSALTQKFKKSGDELIRQCEQNSLIPLVLGFLSLGILQ
ncbi:hypothetical protein O181_017585 [Austropuccinia psidii MF-1]|uniref:SEC7 domain-containing protein n=1 Tax=Austropuccinia psidii MF-1 TaxID=1389203 RepID=A0A9Q3C833_9BASI|nr:hypothetical protein [Austropuccinia psidii MF-1]